MSYDSAVKVFDSPPFADPEGEAQFYSIAYAPGTGRLIQQTANHNLVLPHRVFTSINTIGAADYLTYVRRTRLIGSDGNIIDGSIMSQNVPAMLYSGSSDPISVFHVANSGHLQISKRHNAGAGVGISQWQIDGNPDATDGPIAPAYPGGSGFNAGGPEGNGGRFYVPGRGVYIFQDGSGGTATTGVARYVPGEMNPDAHIDTELFSVTEGDARFLGIDLSGNLYCYRRASSGPPRLYAVSASLGEILFDIVLPNSMPTVGAAWIRENINVVNDGRTLVAGSGLSLHAFDFSDRATLTYLGDVTVEQEEGEFWNNGSQVADCEVFFLNPSTPGTCQQYDWSMQPNPTASGSAGSIAEAMSLAEQALPEEEAIFPDFCAETGGNTYFTLYDYVPWSCEAGDCSEAADPGASMLLQKQNLYRRICGSQLYQYVIYLNVTRSLGNTTSCPIPWPGSLWRLCDPFLECTTVGVDQIVYDLARRAGVPASRIDVAQLAPASDFPPLWGMGIGRPASGRALIEILQAATFFDVAEQGGIISASRRDRDPEGTIGGVDLRAHAYGEQPPTLCERERTEDYEIPREFRVQYSQALAEYEPGVETYSRRVTDAEGVADMDLSAIAMEPDQAAAIAEVAMLEFIVARESQSFHLVATDANKGRKPGAITTLEVLDRTDVVRLVDLSYAFPGIIAVKSLRHDPTVYSSDAVGVGRRAIGSLIINPGPTTFELLDAPLVREHDEAPGYFAAMGGNPTIPGVVEGWPGGDLERLDGSGWEGIARIIRPGNVFGYAATALADGVSTIVNDQELWVTAAGELQSATLQEACFGANLAAVEIRAGGSRIGWELIRYLGADFQDIEGQWKLSNLIRGVNGTEWAMASHAVGDRIVFLGQEAQILADTSIDLDVPRQHNAATIGASANPSLAITFAWSGVDRMPYAPCHIGAERDTDDDVLLTWVRRDRFGMELQSGQILPLSEAEEAYEVDIFGADSDGETVLRTLETSTPEATYTAAQQTADFGSLPAEVEVAVYQIGVLGRGYPGRVTLTL